LCRRRCWQLRIWPSSLAIRAYGFCPETIRAVGEALGVRVLTGLYRAPTPTPGASWPDSGRSGR